MAPHRQLPGYSEAGVGSINLNLLQTKATKADPELAVLSAMAHGRDIDPEKAAQIAIAAFTASVQLDPDRSVLYADLVAASLSEAARKTLQAMDPAKYEYQSEFIKRPFFEGIEKGIEKGLEQGLQQGRHDGQAELVLKLLSSRFGSLPEALIAKVQGAANEDLQRYAERLLSAGSLDDVFA